MPGTPSRKPAARPVRKAAPATGARQRKSGADRRDEIARAVLRIAGEPGMPALTTASLAAEVGVTTGALFRHFPSLDDMLRAAVDHAVRQIEGTFPDADLPPMDRLIQLGRNRVRTIGSDRGLSWLLRSEQAWLSLPDDSVEKLRALVRRSRAFLLAAITDGVGSGAVRSDIEPELLLITVMGTIHALMGMPGVQGRSTQGLARADDALAALAQLLSPLEPPRRPRRSKR